MPIAPEALQPGHCYLTEVGQVRRIVQVLADGRVQFENRRPLPQGGFKWLARIQDARSFVAIVDREVASDWTPAPG